MVKLFLLLAISMVSVGAAEKTYSATEVSQHKSQSDCWLIIDGEVYNVTEYVARHRKHDYDITRHCGTESSTGWNEKPESGKPHSRKAERLLKKYHIGTLAK